MTNASLIVRASFSVSVAIKISPELGTVERPITSTGIEGVASLRFFCLSSVMALTRP